MKTLLIVFILCSLLSDWCSCCLRDYDCPRGEACYKNNCIRIECATSKDCDSSTLHCIKGLCQSSRFNRKTGYRAKRRVPKIGQCRSGFDCGYGKICNRTEFCESVSCDSNTSCKSLSIFKTKCHKGKCQTDFCENDSDCPPMYGCFYTGYCRPFYGVCPRELDCDCKSSSLMCYNRNCYCKDEGLSSRCLRHCLKDKECDSKCEICHHHRCILRDPDSKECFQKPICSTKGPKCCSDGDCSQKCLGTYCCDNSCKHQNEFTLPERCNCFTDKDCYELGDGFECHRCIAVPEYDGKKVCGVVDPKCCRGKQNSCARDEVCTHGTCVQLRCSSNSTCPTCYHAHGSDGICVRAEKCCSSHDECRHTLGKRCINGGCISGSSCRSHDECYRGQHCIKGRCIPSTYCCEKDEDCPQGNQQCVNHGCIKKSSCHKNTDCKICHVCKESKGGLKSCVKAEACCNYGSCKDEKYICNNGACIESQICSNVSPCPSCYICHHDELGVGRCVKANKCCSDDHGCSSYARCHGGACVVEAGFSPRSINCLKATKCECPTPNMNYGIQIKKENPSETCDPGKSKDLLVHRGVGESSSNDTTEENNSQDDSLEYSNGSDESNKQSSSVEIQQHTKQLPINSTFESDTKEYIPSQYSKEYDEYSNEKEHSDTEYADSYNNKVKAASFEYSEEDSSVEKDDYWSEKPQSYSSRPHHDSLLRESHVSEYKGNEIAGPQTESESNSNVRDPERTHQTPSQEETLNESREYFSSHNNEKRHKNLRKKLREYNFDHKFKSNRHINNKEEVREDSEKIDSQNKHESYRINNLDSDIGTFTDYENRSDESRTNNDSEPRNSEEKEKKKNTNQVLDMDDILDSKNTDFDQSIGESNEDRGRFDPYHHEKMNGELKDVINKSLGGNNADQEEIINRETPKVKDESNLAMNEIYYSEDTIPGIKIGQLEESHEESSEKRDTSAESLEDFITYENDIPHNIEKNNPKPSKKKTPGVLMIKLKDTSDISKVVIDHNRTNIPGEEKLDSVKIPRILRDLKLNSSQRKEVWQDSRPEKREKVIYHSRRGPQAIAVMETPKYETDRSLMVQNNNPTKVDPDMLTIGGKTDSLSGRIQKKIEHSKYAVLGERNAQSGFELHIEDANQKYAQNHFSNSLISHPTNNVLNQRKDPVRVNVDIQKKKIVSSSTPSKKPLPTTMQNMINIDIQGSAQEVQLTTTYSTIQPRNTSNRGVTLIQDQYKDTSLICFKKSSLYRERCRKIFCSTVEDCPPCSNCVSWLCQTKENCCSVHEDCLSNQFCSHIHQTCVDCSKFLKGPSERCLK